MEWKPINLKTFIPSLPKKWNESFEALKRYLDIFYDEDRGILVKPVETTGKIKGARGEFVTAIVDNLVVRSQFTNLLENTTTSDLDFVTAFNGGDTSTRTSTWDPSVAVWPLEPSAYSWIDINTSYVKISNDASIAFNTNNIGQEFQIIFDTSVSTSDPYTVLIDSSAGGQLNLVVDASDADKAWIKLIAIAYDVSYGPTWTVKSYGGNYSIS